MPRAVLSVLVLLLCMSQEVLRADENFELFEKKIRPALVQHCYKCHSDAIADPKGGLRVDSREAIRRGGASGPAVVPFKPNESLLLDALAHNNSLYNMPPSGKLPQAVIADFRRWIELGAADPRDLPTGGKLDWQQVMSGRQGWWSLQEVGSPPLPKVRDPLWSWSPIDRYLQAAWEAAAIEPSQPADRLALIRRVSFVLTGLPPSPEDVSAFIAASSDPSLAPADAQRRAYEALVERLLNSPRYGEHWARHWMDLVRYGETHGSEHDPLVPHAWKYRDYIIRAFNGDLPYDRFVHEQLAGDLLPPRWNDTLSINEALLGTMFFRMVEFYPTPVDPKAEEINVVESQIDTFGKTFQALTLACARCHDHKFDAVSAQDFYGLYGIFASTRTTMNRLDRPEALHAHDSVLEAQLPNLRRAIADLWRHELTRWPTRMTAALQRCSAAPPVEKVSKPASEAERDAVALHSVKQFAPSPFYALAQLVPHADGTSRVDQSAWDKLAKTSQNHLREFSIDNRQRYQRFADFSQGQVGSWYLAGQAFRSAEPGALAATGQGDAMLSGIYPRGFYSHLLSDKHGGTFRSPNFTLEMPAIAALVCGTNKARLRLVVENFQGDELLFRGSTPKLSDGHLQWVTIKIRPQWKGRRAYLEVMPRDEMSYVGKVADAGSLPKDGRSGAGIRYVVFLKDERAPELEAITGDDVWQLPPAAERVIEYLRSDVAAAIDAWSENRADDRQARLLDSWMRAGFLPNVAPKDHAAARELAAFRAIEARVPVPQRAPGVADEDGCDERLFDRGDYRQAGDVAPRRYLEVLHSPIYSVRGSGRLKLAQELTSPSNPLTARVMVNRVWQHVFGEGLVRSVDNFGQLGEMPSHPELLDHLATRFVAGGWSIKQLLRELLLSRSFQLSSQASSAAHELDPDNRLWSHALVRRIEAESIRDSLLFVSGRLDPTMYGLGVPLPLPAGYKDFDVPAAGPLDGRGRRSVFLEARRNYPLALLMAFDQPRPMNSVGRRDVTNVPAQSLALLNDPFVREQSEQLAHRILSTGASSTAERITRLYQQALSRLPSESESARAEAFLARQEPLYKSAAEPQRVVGPWRDLAHALVNLKEFIYLR